MQLLLGLRLVLGLLLLLVVVLGLRLWTDWGRLRLLEVLLDRSGSGETLFAGSLREAGVVETRIVRTVIVVGGIASVVVAVLLGLVGLGLVLTVLRLLLVLWLRSVLWWSWRSLRQMIAASLESGLVTS